MVKANMWETYKKLRRARSAQVRNVLIGGLTVGIVATIYLQDFIVGVGLGYVVGFIIGLAHYPRVHRLEQIVNPWRDR
jgi:hypothetical protein